MDSLDYDAALNILEVMKLNNLGERSFETELKYANVVTKGWNIIFYWGGGGGGRLLFLGFADNFSFSKNVFQTSFSLHFVMKTIFLRPFSFKKV